MADTTVTQQIVSESPEIEAYKRRLLQQAEDLALNVGGRTPLGQQLPQYQVAGFQEPQLAAIRAATQQGIGAYAPYITGAGQAVGQGVSTTAEAADVLRGADTRGQFTDAQRALQAAAGQSMGATQRYNPADVAGFMNPYQQQVIDASMRQIERQGQIAQQGLAAQAVRSGAFGGLREGVQRAEMQRGLLEQKANTIAGLMNQGYSQAQANALASFEQQQQRQMASAGQLQNIGMGIGQLAGQQFGIGQATAQGLGQLGGQLGQLGVQQAALGQTAQAMQQGDVNFLYNIGQAQQALEQQRLDAERASALQRIYAPYQQASFLSDIYRGAPSSQMATTAASQPSASPFQQAVGIGLGAVATAAGAKKAGLFS